MAYVRSTSAPVRISKLFSDRHADVIFSSSDGVQFNIHQKNLEIATGPFPRAEYSTGKAVVHLTESSAVLEVLFQFLYPKEHPDIDTIAPFEIFAQLADAAEKYEVYPAINVCKTRMRYTCLNPESDNPKDYARVLAYASKHWYMDIADIAAPLTISMRQADVITLLTPLPFTIAPYLNYVAEWDAVFRSAVKIFEIEPYQIRCDGCDITVQVLTRLGASLESLLNLDAVFEDLSSGCANCTNLCNYCHLTIADAIKEIPSISTFFSS